MGSAGQRIGRTLLTDLERRANHVQVTADLIRGDRVHPDLHIIDLQDLDVHPGLPGDHGEIGVEVEHAGVGVTEEPEAPAAKCPCRDRGGHPVADLSPGLSASLPILLAQQTADDVEGDAAAGKGAGQLRHAADAAVGEPFAGVGPLIVERRGGLEIQHEHGAVDALHGRDDLRRGGIGADVADDEIDVLAGEADAGLFCGRGGVDEPRGDDVRAEGA